MLIIERFISCDNCGDSYGVDNRSAWKNAKEIRASAKREGWKFWNGSDYCAECVEKSRSKEVKGMYEELTNLHPQRIA